MTREDIECIIKWFSHIEQLATDGKTANGFQMPPDKILTTIKVVAKDSREYVEKFCYESTPNDLEEAAWDCVLDSVDVNNPVLLPKYKELLTYLFIAGAKWQEEKDQETIKLAEDHAFLAGADWQKGQMLKEGDEGIVRRAGPIGYITFTDEQQFNSRLEQFQDCDKVRIIIVKED